MARFRAGRGTPRLLPGHGPGAPFHAIARRGHMRARNGGALPIGPLCDAIARIYVYIRDSSRITAIEGLARVIHESSISIYIDRINRQKDTPIDTPLVRRALAGSFPQ